MKQLNGRDLIRYPREALVYFLGELRPQNTESRELSKDNLAKRIVHDAGLSKDLTVFLRANPIFQDPQFIDCWNAAFPDDGTVCIKTSFGACAYDETGKLIASANNKRIGTHCGISSPLCSDEAGCARIRITSRIDQTIGECNHSIIWLLKDLFTLGYTPATLSRVRVYEVGFLVSEGSKPWVRKEKNYTCLYCVRMFLTFGLQTVWGVVGEKEHARWHALDSAADYQELAGRALQELEV